MRRRQGFTLVELLVSVALIVLIMAIVSQAFVEGLETFRQFKGIGDLQENLRSAIVPLRNDLIAPHVQDNRLTDVKLSALAINTQGMPTPARPKAGFFRIQGSTPQTEGLDGTGLPSYSAVDHILHFTIELKGLTRNDFLTASIPPPSNPAAPVDRLSQQGSNPDYRSPGTPAQPNPPGPTPGTMISQWAEVCWFLSPLLDPVTRQPLTATVPNGGGKATPLFGLYRRQRLLVGNNPDMNAIPRVPVTDPATNQPMVAVIPEVCCFPDPTSPGNLFFPKPSQVVQATTPMPATAATRMGRAMSDPTTGNSIPFPMGTTKIEQAFASQLLNNDLVVSDVVSFVVRVLFNPAYPTPAAYDFQDIPAGGYDTATSPAAQYRIKAIQVILRVWDRKTEQTRQVTMIQDM